MVNTARPGPPAVGRRPRYGPIVTAGQARQP